MQINSWDATFLKFFIKYLSCSQISTIEPRNLGVVCELLLWFSFISIIASSLPWSLCSWIVWILLLGISWSVISLRCALLCFTSRYGDFSIIDSLSISSQNIHNFYNFCEYTKISPQLNICNFIIFLGVVHWFP